jgi:ornithine cyclodeaminase
LKFLTPSDDARSNHARRCRSPVDHIGELKIPLAQGAIARKDIQADFYGVANGCFSRPSAEAITICKNGGGAHLDLMTSQYILEKWYESR